MTCFRAKGSTVDRTHSLELHVPLVVLLPLAKASQSPVPRGRSRSQMKDREESRWTTLVNPSEDVGRGTPK